MRSPPALCFRGQLSSEFFSAEFFSAEFFSAEFFSAEVFQCRVASALYGTFDFFLAILIRIFSFACDLVKKPAGVGGSGFTPFSTRQCQ